MRIRTCLRIQVYIETILSFKRKHVETSNNPHYLLSTTHEVAFCLLYTSIFLKHLHSLCVFFIFRTLSYNSMLTIELVFTMRHMTFFSDLFFSQCGTRFFLSRLLKIYNKSHLKNGAKQG